jgi:hypothetical protein
LGASGGVEPSVRRRRTGLWNALAFQYSNKNAEAFLFRFYPLRGSAGGRITGKVRSGASQSASVFFRIAGSTKPDTQSCYIFFLGAQKILN